MAEQVRWSARTREISNSRKRALCMGVCDLHRFETIVF